MHGLQGRGLELWVRRRIYMFVGEFLFGSPIPVQVSGRRDGSDFGRKIRRVLTTHERSLEAVTTISIGPPVPIRPGIIAVISLW